MYITHVTFKLSGIDEKAYSGAIDNLAPQYAKVPGLISKAWIKQPESGTYGGIYFWASREDYENYSKSELCSAVTNHPNLAEFHTAAYENMPEGTSVTAGVCRF
jgi:hypothetical protein